MATTTNFGWTTPNDTDLVKDGAAAIRTLGNSIDTSFVDLKGGTTNQVLAKNSGTDLDFKWVADATGIPATIIDAKGDLIAGTAADTAGRLAVGTNGQVLTADSAETTGLKWATPASGGKVLQVVQTTFTGNTAIATTTLTDTGLTATITPTLATSKILVMYNCNIYVYRSTGAAGIGSELFRGATSIAVMQGVGTAGAGTGTYYIACGGANEGMVRTSMVYLDSPATTSATTYKVQARLNATSNSASSYWGADDTNTMVLMEIGA